MWDVLSEYDLFYIKFQHRTEFSTYIIICPINIIYSPNMLVYLMLSFKHAFVYLLNKRLE